MPTYPITNYHFQVEWGGTRIGFEEVSNLTFGVPVIEYREGSSKEYHSIKMPGRPYFENIILKRGVMKADNDFFQWWNTIQMNTVERRDMVISLLDEEHAPVVTWKIKNAFPVKITWSDLKAAGNEVFIESLEIAVESIVVESA